MSWFRENWHRVLVRIYSTAYAAGLLYVISVKPVAHVVSVLWP